MYIRILFLSLFLCSAHISFAQKIWKYAKDSCMPADLSEHTLLFPITPDKDRELKFDYNKAEKIFKKYYPYPYAFVPEDSLKYTDSLSNYYALRKEVIYRTTSSSTPHYSSTGRIGNPSRYGGNYLYSSGTHSSTYQAFQYRFTKGNDTYSFYKTLEIYSTIRYKSLRMIVRNLHYDIPANRPSHCIKINMVAPIPMYSRIGASYEYILFHKTSVGMYIEAGSWKYKSPFDLTFLSSDFILFQPQLIRYFSIFNNNPCEGWMLGIAPYLFYNKDYFNPSDPNTTEHSQTITGYGAKGIIGYQLMIGKIFIVSAWGGPQYRFNAKNTYENTFLSSNYSTISFTGQVSVGFVLK